MNHMKITFGAIAACALAITLSGITPIHAAERMHPVRVVRLADAVLGRQQQGTLQYFDKMITSEIENADGLLDPAKGPAVFRQKYQTDLKGLFKYMQTYDLPPAVRSGTVFLDFGRRIEGRLMLDCEGPKDAAVEIACGPFLVGGEIIDPKTVKVSLDGGRKSWTQPEAANFRYVSLTFHYPSAEVRIFEVAIEGGRIVDEGGEVAVEDDFVPPVVHGPEAEMTAPPTADSFDVAGAPAVRIAKIDWGKALFFWCPTPAEWAEKAPYKLFKSPVNYAVWRKEFELAEVPDRALLHAFGAGEFRVWLNGRIVGMGPRRGIPAVYPTFDVTGFLKPGTNVLAAEACSIFGGLLNFGARLHGDKGLEVVTDNTWQSLPMGGWEAFTHSASWKSQQEVFDLNRLPSAWLKPGFAAAGWSPAKPGGGMGATSDPVVPGVTRRWVGPKRVVRMAEAVSLEPYHPTSEVALNLGREAWDVLRTSEILHPEGLLDPAKGPTIIRRVISRPLGAAAALHKERGIAPDERAPTLLLNLEAHIKGYFFIDIDGPKGAIVDIGYGPDCIGGRLLSPRSKRLILDGNRSQWESFHYEEARFLTLTLRNFKEPITVHRFGMVDADVLPPIIGSFACSDELLTRMWQADIATIRATTHDIFMDNTFRERKGWVCSEGVSPIRTLGVATGNIPLARYFLREYTKDPEHFSYLVDVIVEGQRPKSSEHIRFFYHPLQAFLFMENYRHFVTPTEYAEDKVLECYRPYVAILHGLIGSNGLIVDHPGVLWRDWAPLKSPIGVLSQPGLRGYTEAAAEANLFVVLLTRGLADAEEAAGQTAEATRLRQRADQLAATVAERFWVPERGLYADKLLVDGKPAMQFSEHANCLALLADLGGQERSKKVLENLERNLADPDGEIIEYDMQCSPGISALFKVGRPDLAIAFLKRNYGPMMNYLPNATFWEQRHLLLVQGIGIQRPFSVAGVSAYAQAGPVSPAFFLSTEVLGIKPVQPGFAEFEVAPQMADLSWAEGVMPTPHGLIPARWEHRDGRFQLDITVPQGTKATVRLPQAATYTVNGNRHSDGILADGRYTIPLGPGVYRCVAE